jgi:hypothetical protein
VTRRSNKVAGPATLSAACEVPPCAKPRSKVADRLLPVGTTSPAGTKFGSPAVMGILSSIGENRSRHPQQSCRSGTGHEVVGCAKAGFAAAGTPCFLPQRRAVGRRPPVGGLGPPYRTQTMGRDSNGGTGLERWDGTRNGGRGLGWWDGTGTVGRHPTSGRERQILSHLAVATKPELGREVVGYRKILDMRLHPPCCSRTGLNPPLE